MRKKCASRLTRQRRFTARAFHTQHMHCRLVQNWQKRKLNAVRCEAKPEIKTEIKFKVNFRNHSAEKLFLLSLSWRFFSHPSGTFSCVCYPEHHRISLKYINISIKCIVACFCVHTYLNEWATKKRHATRWNWIEDDGERETVSRDSQRFPKIMMMWKLWKAS